MNASAATSGVGLEKTPPGICSGGSGLASLLYRLIRPHQLRIVAIVSLVLVCSLLEAASFSLLVPLTRSFTPGDPQGDTMGSVFRTYEAWLGRYGPDERIGILALALGGLFAFKNLLQYVRENLGTRLCLGISADTRREVLAVLLQRPYAYFLERKQGALVQHIYHEPHHVAYLVREGIEQAANVLMVFMLVGLLLLVSWQITLLVLAVGSLYGLVVWSISKKLHGGGERRQQVEAEAMALLTEAISGIRQVKVFSAEGRVHALYSTWVQSLREIQTRHWLTMFLPHHVTEMFWVGVLSLLLGLPALGIGVDSGDMLPIIAVFSVSAFRIGPYVSRISQGWLTLNFLAPALRLIGELLEPPSVRASLQVQKPAIRSLDQAIMFADVTFSYGNARPALSRVSVSFNRGETTAVIGPSGAGKSTLVDLIVRLYEPASGSITVDGRDLRDYDLASWLSLIGFVSQDTFIFHGTIRDNIAFSRPDVPMEKIEAAARKANAHDFIERCPRGYETVIGERGLKLSGGERQRIAIARALLRDPEVLIFDEATSALDTQSEALIQDAIAAISRDRTVIVIAHRLSTVVQADKIVVLECGRVVEEGTHASLLGRGGLYSELYGKTLA